MTTAKKRNTVASLSQATTAPHRTTLRAATRNEQQARPSTERTLQILAQIAAAGGPLAVTDLAALTGLPKSTTSRLCEKLRRGGYLVREPGSASLAVGPRLFRLGLDIVRQSGVTSARHTILAELVADIGETCNLTALAGSEVLYLDRVETRWPLRLALEPGSRVPLHCTASGKLFLSRLPVTELEAVLRLVCLTANTPRTLTTRTRLARELKRIADRGYSLDNEEFITGLVAVAVPVVDDRGRIVAALACHAPVARLDLRAAIALVPRLKRAAARIGSTTGTGQT